MIIRTLGSLLESRIFLGTAPFGQQIHCQRNKAPHLDLLGHIANFLFSTYNYLNITPSQCPLALEDSLKPLLQYYHAEMIGMMTNFHLKI